MKEFHLMIGHIATIVLAWSMAGCGAIAMDLTITATDQPIAAGPVCFTPSQPLEADATYQLIDADGSQINAQSDREGRLWWWSSPLKTGSSTTYKIVATRLDPNAASAITVRKTGEYAIQITAKGQPFTTFNFKPTEPKPYLYPLIGPTGDPVTRDYPMVNNPVEKNNNRQDHPHHRSLWCAHGEIRVPGLEKDYANFWHETEPAKQDKQVLKRIVRTVSGPVFGQITADIDWVASTGRKLFTEQRTYTFFASDSNRIIDAANVFKFDQSDVTFLDTKEGGIMAVRLAVTMDEQGIENRKVHGQMTNSQGGLGAGECWGKPAAWCDYVGPVNGHTVGVAILDHPENFRHPTRWHIRNYGLYTANPFGLSHFTEKEKKKLNGDHTWKKGEAVTFNYRVIIHKDDTKAAGIPSQWTLYSNPPAMK